MDQNPAPAEIGRFPGYEFSTLAQLVVTADAVVVGSVEAVAQGHPLSPGDSSFLVRDVRFRVEEQFYGEPVPDTVVIDQEGLDAVSDGDQTEYRPFEFTEQPWVYVGEQVVYFLTVEPNRPAGHYAIVAMPGQMVIQEGVVQVPAADPVADTVDGVSWAQVQERLTAAVRVAQSGAVEPLEDGEQ